ncbi:uncharacterized protein BJ171DRAFT_428466 [Polychytrium aggregatum]|uniref:uncharacterized protein n=1 Tax=Polychytrium aggregatum TaxID=110093 RepID=UPI0022FE2B14|nr:uncharacterized protein BJ171DRAFT_428466 [Polychytrium aggregatum]KAI9197221.1 hypothetical protein BJ171DRAFT_428466 [Polychytrium aggregatum]
MAQKTFIRRKLVVVGDGACGKTSLLIVFSNKDFPQDHIPTVFDNYVADIIVNGHTVELALWDTAGQEDYDRLRPLSYPDSHVIFICFSVDSPDSLENVELQWYPEVRKYCPNVPIVLVGCKKDLRTDPDTIASLRAIGLEPVTAQQGFAVAQRLQLYRYVETSAKTREGVNEAFDHACRAALTNITPKKRPCVIL